MKKIVNVIAHLIFISYAILHMGFNFEIGNFELASLIIVFIILKNGKHE